MPGADDQLTALADPTRRTVFELVRKQPRPVGEIARLLPVSRPAVSQHLRVLEEAGLVAASQNGTRRIYEIDHSGLIELRDWVDGLWDEVLDRFETLVEKEAEMLKTSDLIAPVTKTRELGVGVEVAFELFTTRIAEWWPVASYSIHHEDVADVRFEGRVGGRVVEITNDGTEYSWAHVLAWDPPNRLALSWYPDVEPIASSIVEVRFTPLSEARTRLDLEHRGWEEFGPEGAGLRDRYESGWDAVLRPLEDVAG
jgi:DNA-binding transcriptional ArsR family regulator